MVALGLIVFRKAPLRRDVAFALFAAAGLINGYALGETIAGAERTPILAYFIGLAAIQIAIALAVMFGVRMLTGAGAGAAAGHAGDRRVRGRRRAPRSCCSATRRARS